MFKFEEICELIRLVGSTHVAGIEIEHGESRVRIEGATPVVTPETYHGASGPAVPVAPFAADQGPAVPVSGSAQSTGATGPASGAPEEELHHVISPIVGTFYRAPNPDAEPYVKVGDYVEKGQVLCIVEAMKLMNEIESDSAGEIVRVFPENAQPVEFGERLFAIRQG